jgi:hypothetical protein
MPEDMVFGGLLLAPGQNNIYGPLPPEQARYCVDHSSPCIVHPGKQLQTGDTFTLALNLPGGTLPFIDANHQKKVALIRA